jgi:hypothetical protein
MRLLTPMAQRALVGRTIDVPDRATNRGTRRGFARVDRDDPVFFDHPLDHVPGMLLAAASLEVAEQLLLLERDAVIFRMTFTKFCEFDAPVEVMGTRVTEGAGRIEIVQSGRRVANSSLAQRRVHPLSECATIPALRDGPLSGELVHRANPSNIAIGPLSLEEGRVWTRIRDRNAICGLPPRAGAVASVVEAARQFAIAILHRWGGHPLGTKMIFVGLTAEVPTATPPADVEQALSWHVTPPEQMGKLRIDLYTVGDRASELGSILIAARCVNEDEYAQLRAV